MKMFVWHCLPRVSLGESVGRRSAFFLFFLNIYYLHMDRNGKKNNLRIWRKFFWSSTKQVSRSAIPNKLFFIFGQAMGPHLSLPPLEEFP